MDSEILSICFAVLIENKNTKTVGSVFLNLKKAISTYSAQIPSYLGCNNNTIGISN